MKETTIERGVGIPVRRTPYGRYADMLRSMRDGDSAEVAANQIPAIRTQAARMGMRISARRMENNSYRIWRTK